MPQPSPAHAHANFDQDGRLDLEQGLCVMTLPFLCLRARTTLHTSCISRDIEHQVGDSFYTWGNCIFAATKRNSEDGVSDLKRVLGGPNSR